MACNRDETTIGELIRRFHESIDELLNLLRTRLLHAFNEELSSFEQSIDLIMQAVSEQAKIAGMWSMYGCESTGDTLCYISNNQWTAGGQHQQQPMLSAVGEPSELGGSPSVSKDGIDTKTIDQVLSRMLAHSAKILIAALNKQK